ncbi:MAG: hypothetical protein N2484_07660 [Clostridia bacterium]|nr:hypothetical protein [Clostridia bacterium]
MLREDELSYRERIIAEAKADGLADGICKIVFYNREQVSWTPVSEEKLIDPYGVFPNESRGVVSGWISKAYNLLDKNYDVADALFDCNAARQRQDPEAIKKAEGKFHEIRNQFVSNNPGFSEELYDRAIQMGIRKVFR